MKFKKKKKKKKKNKGRLPNEMEDKSEFSNSELSNLIHKIKREQLDIETAFR